MAVGSWLYDEDTLKGVLPVGVLVYYLACYDRVPFGSWLGYWSV
jgi:hypothetical protein